MSNDDILNGLNSSSPSDRVKSATWLKMNPHEIPSVNLMSALQSETVGRIRSLLLDVLAARQSKKAPSDGEPRVIKNQDVLEVVASRNVNQFDVAATLKHELSPAIGWILIAGDEEIPNFRKSLTFKEIEKLRERLDGLIVLVKDGEGLNLQTASLTELLQASWPRKKEMPSIEIETKHSDIRIETDTSLFDIFISNVYRNAAESHSESKSSSPINIVWGATPDRYWVRVSNSFSGHNFSLSDVHSAGSSSKEAHQGQGMTTIFESAKLLDIGFTLSGKNQLATFSFSGSRT